MYNKIESIDGKMLKVELPSGEIKYLNTIKLGDFKRINSVEEV